MARPQIYCINVSLKKKSNIFPVDWAYKVGKKYNLLTEWKMEGTGPMRLEGSGAKKGSHTGYIFLDGIKLWLDDIIIEDEAAEDWFKYEFNLSFPQFKEWLKKKGMI